MAIHPSPWIYLDKGVKPADALLVLGILPRGSMRHRSWPTNCLQCDWRPFRMRKWCPSWGTLSAAPGIDAHETARWVAGVGCAEPGWVRVARGGAEIRGSATALRGVSV